mmetsp:Transcript_20329/g.56523  ORF Transcript_20329/g.56523 Transcript_20329/m.56523 type:complete len:216 (-) Transcript_20329:7-654(-)
MSQPQDPIGFHVRYGLHVVDLDHKLLLNTEIPDGDFVQEGGARRHRAIAIPEGDPVADLFRRTGLRHVETCGALFALGAILRRDPQVGAPRVGYHLEFLPGAAVAGTAHRNLQVVLHVIIVPELARVGILNAQAPRRVRDNGRAVCSVCRRMLGQMEAKNQPPVLRGQAARNSKQRRHAEQGRFPAPCFDTAPGRHCAPEPRCVGASSPATQRKT